MKKLGIIAMAFALVLGMSQCKKENTNSSIDDGVKVPITLNVSGNSSSRVAVEGSTGVVTFEDGDVIHVSSNGVYVGTMTYNGTVFSGEITEPTEGQKLHFYFLGNKTPEFNSDNTGCSVIISDQTTELPVISYAPSRENYQIGKTNYNATLLNKCALVKFDVTTSSEAATCILSMSNKVNIYFINNSFSYSKDGEGMITMAAGSGEKWAILLPQPPLTHPGTCSSDGVYIGTSNNVPEIYENGYLTEGISLTVNTPKGSLSSLFTVNADGDQVYFSQGNLQYIGSAATPYWKFADHQWDYLGTTTGQNSSDPNVDRDLFGWGTSGYNLGFADYQPWTITWNGDYWPYNLYDQTGQADWGYNAIANGGNTENSGWRTLTRQEGSYIFFTRSTASGIRFAKGQVNGVNGVILLPDNWDASVYTLNHTNYTDYGGMDNDITADDWTNILEANGAVFLPFAGRRVEAWVTDAGGDGKYWTASSCGGSERYGWELGIGGIYTESGLYYCQGYSVRLVHDAE